MKYIIDLQGFKAEGNKFIFKELAYYSFETGQTSVYLFKPPFPWSQLGARYKSQNSWLIRIYHGLDWYSGKHDYNCLNSEIAQEIGESEVVFVKGIEKQRWLSNQFPNISNIINLEDLGCPSIIKLSYQDVVPFICTNNHKDTIINPSCALQNVLVLRNWFLKNKKL